MGRRKLGRTGPFGAPAGGQSMRILGKGEFNLQQEAKALAYPAYPVAALERAIRATRKSPG